jgi:hypothetical protein
MNNDLFLYIVLSGKRPFTGHMPCKGYDLSLGGLNSMSYAFPRHERYL